MGRLLHSLRVYSDGSILAERAERPPLWRVLHDLETPKGVWRPNLPEVFPLFPSHFSDFGRGWQLLSKAMNPKISASKWTNVYTYALWIANGQGFGDESDQRANYVAGRNLDKPNPRVECLTTGGSVLTGYVEGSNLVVRTLDVNVVPPLDWVMARPWFWTYAVTVDGRGIPRKFPQGLQADGSIVPIVHPLIANPSRYPKITIPLSSLERWTADELPDPFRLYRI